MTADYWTTFWRHHGSCSQTADPQSQVLRTLQRQPIADDAWRSTLSYIIAQLDLAPQNATLDLCGGNGLIASEIAKYCQQVIVVDISPDLLRIAETQAKNINVLTADMRAVDFPLARFDRILCYAALQYLDPAETIQLFEKAYDWLQPGGIFFVGDIPDAALQWRFFDTDERREAYFENLKCGRPVVGTWFDSAWLTQLASHVGFTNLKCLKQPDDQIYSWFRFDFRCVK